MIGFTFDKHLMETFILSIGFLEVKAGLFYLVKGAYRNSRNHFKSTTKQMLRGPMDLKMRGKLYFDDMTS